MQRTWELVQPEYHARVQSLYAVPDTTSPETDERLMAGLQFIDTHYSQPTLSLSDVSKPAGLSIWHFSRLFNAHVGMGFREYLKNVRLKHACKLLATSTLTIKEIAAMVGYTHVSDFYHHFKEQYDLTPVIYRRLARTAAMNGLSATAPNRKQEVPTI
jgi:two-component system, response regulator YesN